MFALEGGGRRIEVEFEAGYPVAQVYAPPGEDYVCFEPMTAPIDALVSGDGPAPRAAGGERDYALCASAGRHLEQEVVGLPLRPDQADGAADRYQQALRVHVAGVEAR